MILKDPKHWIGWGLTTGAIVLMYNLLNFTGVVNSFFEIGLLFSVIVVVDLIKHVTKLQ